MGEKHLHRRYGEIQAANRPSLAYYNADKCLSDLWTDSCLRCDGESAFSTVLAFNMAAAKRTCTENDVTQNC